MAKRFVPTSKAINIAAERLYSFGFNDAKRTITDILKYNWFDHPAPTHTGALQIVLSRDEKHFGIVINPRAYHCRMEGCTGMRQAVRWDDGQLTYPCTKGLTYVGENVDKIG